jgi:hypothetical protein
VASCSLDFVAYSLKLLIFRDIKKQLFSILKVIIYSAQGDRGFYLSFFFFLSQYIDFVENSRSCGNFGLFSVGTSGERGVKGLVSQLRQ